MSEAQENTKPAINAPQFLNPSAQPLHKPSKSSILSQPIDKGVTKPAVRHSIVPTSSTRVATTTKARLSMVPTTSSARLSTISTTTTRPSNTTTTGRLATTSTRNTKPSIPTQPARHIYSTKALERSPPKSITDTSTKAPKSDQQLKLKLENMEGMMTALVSQISVMQSQYLHPPEPSQALTQPVHSSPIQVHVPIPMQVPAPVKKVKKIKEKKPPRIEERIVVQKVIKKVPKPKPPKPIIDTTIYTKQIEELNQKLEELQRIQTEEEFNFQLESESANSKLQFLNTQLETMNGHVNIEREKGYQLKNEIANKSSENSQLEFNFLGVKSQMNEQIQTTKKVLTEELQQKISSNNEALDKLQTQFEFYQNECKERDEERCMLEKNIQEEIDTTARTEKRIRTSETLRKKLHNEIQELKGNIRVICRVRPLLGKEKAGNVSYTFPKGDQELFIDKKPINDVTSKKSTAGSQGMQSQHNLFYSCL